MHFNVCLSDQVRVYAAGVVTLRLFKWISLGWNFAMQRKNASSDPDTSESEYRAVGREETLPNFVHNHPQSRAENDEQTGECTDESVSVVRDGDEYLIVGSNEDDVWMERVPAIRHAVVQGERLRKIPGNWTQHLHVQNDDAPDQILYKIPDPAVNVIVRTPRQDDSDDIRYEVEDIGMAVPRLEKKPDSDALRNLISTVEEQNDESEAVLAALQRVEDEWHKFVREYRGDLDRRGGEMVSGMFKTEGQGIVESWSINPWETEQDITRLIPGSRDIDNKVLSQVASRLVDAGVVSPSPAFVVDFSSGEGLPPGYFLQALTEAGCSPAEAIDWTMVKTRGHTQATWSDVRGEYEGQIAENIRAADSTLTS